MLLRAGFSAAALFALALPARGADPPAAIWKHQNPFCGVLAQVAPTTDGSGYGVALFAVSGASVDAHVTLVGRTDAYDAYLTAARLEGAPNDRESEGVVVKVPADAGIAWYFVDSYAIDGAKPVNCPSYVLPVGSERVDAPEGTRAIPASHLQALPPLTCGKTYIQARLHGDFESPVGRFGNRPLTVEARSYIDSNGYSAREELVTSSGVAGLDDYMLGAMHVHQFSPAQFLCTPVVSTIDVELKYFP